MRRAIQLLVLVVIVLSVRACGVNESYDRLKAASRWAMEKVGL
jgi:hypothetical protein